MQSDVKLRKMLNPRNVRAFIECMWLKIKEYEQESQCFIIILKGGVYTANQLLRLHGASEESDLVVGYLGLSSYNDKVVPEKEVEISYSLDLAGKYIKDRHVWIVDDVIQSGTTLEKAKEIVKTFGPRSIQTAVLVDKIKYREESQCVRPSVVGYVYPGDKFLVGCGLDYKERYRYLSSLYELEE